MDIFFDASGIDYLLLIRFEISPLMLNSSSIRGIIKVL